MEKKKFEDKKLELLTDEALMEVVGGEKITIPAVVQQMLKYCNPKSPAPKCKAERYCVWINGGCWPNPNQFAY